MRLIAQKSKRLIARGLRLLAYLLNLLRNAGIQAAYSAYQLRAEQEHGLAVEHSVSGEEDIEFKDGTTDWDAVLAHMDGERPVVSKLYNQTGTGEVSFAGPDRPELALIGDTQMVCVEREATNLFLNSDSPTQQDISVDEKKYTLSFDGDGSVELTNAYTETVSGSASERTQHTFTPSDGTLNVEPTGTVNDVQVEEGNYSTLLIETGGSEVTRIDPSPHIPDFIPSTGYIAGWVDMVKDNGFLFSGDVSLQLQGNTFVAFVKDQMLAVESPFTWDEFTRKKIGFVLEWNGDVKLHLVDDNGDYHTAEASADYDAIEDTDITLGNQTSVYWHNIIKG